MSLYNELSYTDNIKEIVGVQFGVLSPEEIKRRSGQIKFKSNKARFIIQTNR